MMQIEFERIAGYEVTEDDYRNIIEPMYMATNLSKEEFAATLDKKRFEYIPAKTDEQIRIEEEVNRSIAEYEAAITFLKSDLAFKESILEVEEDPFWKDRWKMDIKNYKDDIKKYKNMIKSLKWVLA